MAPAESSDVDILAYIISRLGTDESILSQKITQIHTSMTQKGASHATATCSATGEFSPPGGPSTVEGYKKHIVSMMEVGKCDVTATGSPFQGLGCYVVAYILIFAIDL